MSPEPVITLLAGPNGAGKSTAAPSILQGLGETGPYLNADTVALGLDGLNPERVAFAAGRLVLIRSRTLTAQGESFTLETTLASRSFAPWLRKAKAGGYQLRLLFLHLRSPDLALRRVAARVAAGGHTIPEKVVTRRYHAGLRNFFTLYRPLADAWALYDNSYEEPRLVAAHVLGATAIHDEAFWLKLERDDEP